jgi:hypothetical protein
MADTLKGDHRMPTVQKAITATPKSNTLQPLCFIVKINGRTKVSVQPYAVQANRDTDGAQN